jgi:phosphate uptake regulator
LPRDWVRKRNLRRGDRVFLAEEGATLRLMTEQTAEERRRGSTSTVVDSDQCPGGGFLERVIVGNYILGREKITIVSKRRLSGEHLEAARRVVRRLIGIGIIEETHNRLVLHCAIDPANHPLDTLIRRLYQLGWTMLNESLDSLMRGRVEYADDALRREDDSDMMYWLILRLILSAQADAKVAEQLGIGSPVEIPQYHLISGNLETVADHCATIAGSVKDLLAMGVRLPDRLKRLYLGQSEVIGKMYQHALTGLLSQDLRRANEAILLENELERRDEEIIRMVVREIKDPKVVIPLRVISGRMARIGEYAVSIALVAFNRYLLRSSPLCRLETAPAR